VAKKRKKSGLARMTAFHAVMAVFVLLAAAGLARVSLSAKCAEAAVDAGELRSDIRAELQESDQLEVAKHSLSNPSRLDNIAATSMGMTTPQDVCYLALPGGTVQEVACEETAALAASPDAPAATEAGLSPILRTVMDMAAGEAQVLLVGDVGLASER
jgi:hypothetical protein